MKRLQLVMRTAGTTANENKEAKGSSDNSDEYTPRKTNACTLAWRLIVLVWLLIDCWRDLVTALKQCVSHRQWRKETVDPPDRHHDESTEATSAKAAQNRSDQPGGTNCWRSARQQIEWSE
jgi:hypothetical protein